MSFLSGSQFSKYGDESTLYHGTGAWLRVGDEVRPTDTVHTEEPRAYATSSPYQAAVYSHKNASGQHMASGGDVSLFKPVYQVEPKGGQTRTVQHPNHPIHTKSDAEGMKVKGTAGYVSHDFKPL